ncbi:MAG: isochorismatase family protein [Pyrinomonadaceae bacterium]
MPHSTILDKSKTVLVVIDFQEAFRSAIPDFALIASRISMAVRGFQILDVPIIVTEQYPKGLGRTAEEILFTLPAEFEFFEKSAFSSCGAQGFKNKLQELNASQIVLCGVETHVCVNQTAHDLLDENYQVHLLTDAVASRYSHDNQAGLEKMRMNGVVSSSVEMALFELMRDSKHEQFKEIQNLIK